MLSRPGPLAGAPPGAAARPAAHPPSLPPHGRPAVGLRAVMPDTGRSGPDGRAGTSRAGAGAGLGSVGRAGSMALDLPGSLAAAQQHGQPAGRPWRGRRPEPEVVRRRWTVAGYAAFNVASIAATGLIARRWLATGAAAHAGLLVGGGLVLPMASLVATRALPPGRPVAKHAALVALDVGIGIGLTAAGAWGSGVLLTALCALALMAGVLALAAWSGLDGYLGPRLGRGAEEAALIGLAFGPAMGGLLPAGPAGAAVQALVWTLGFGFVCLMFIDKARVLSAEVERDRQFDAINASIALYTPLLSLLFNLCRAGAALPAWRPHAG